MDNQAFVDDLKERAKKKRELRFEEFKRKKKHGGATHSLTLVGDAFKVLAKLTPEQLEEVGMLLSMQHKEQGPVTFTVLEYGETGKIKSFRVE